MSKQSTDNAIAATATTNVLIKEENIKKESSDSTGGDENGVTTSTTDATVVSSATTASSSAASTTTTTTLATSTSSTDTNSSVTTVNSGYTPNGIKTEALTTPTTAKASAITADGKPLLLPNEIKQEKAVDNIVTPVVNSVALNANKDDDKLDDIRYVLCIEYLIDFKFHTE